LALDDHITTLLDTEEGHAHVSEVLNWLANAVDIRRKEAGLDIIDGPEIRENLFIQLIDSGLSFRSWHYQALMTVIVIPALNHCPETFGRFD
jgi:hypothetical protein